MFGISKKQNLKKQENYARVYRLHEEADFLCYINDAYFEEYQGTQVMKLEGVVVKGTGSLTDTFCLYDCNGRLKAEITVEELYQGSDRVEQLQGGDKRVALYPKEQADYRAGDLLCICRNYD